MGLSESKTQEMIDASILEDSVCGEGFLTMHGVNNAGNKLTKQHDDGTSSYNFAKNEKLSVLDCAALCVQHNEEKSDGDDECQGISYLYRGTSAGICYLNSNSNASNFSHSAGYVFCQLKDQPTYPVNFDGVEPETETDDTQQ